jgi:hypothetical protein
MMASSEEATIAARNRSVGTALGTSGGSGVVRGTGRSGIVEGFDLPAADVTMRTRNEHDRLPSHQDHYWPGTVPDGSGSEVRSENIVLVGSDNVHYRPLHGSRQIVS